MTQPVYVVIDLEWNQPLSFSNPVYRRVGDRLLFELIQLGAVKLDHQRRMVGSFSRFIAPAHYLKLHPRIRRITGISREDLDGAPSFCQVIDAFALWCGPGCSLLTWGSDDLSVLKQNLDFFACPYDIPPAYDLQRLYAALQGDPKRRRGLSAAMEECHVPYSEEHPFHSAVDDAYNTALVFQRFPDAQAVFQHPQTPRPLGGVKNGRRERTEESAVASEAAYFLSRSARKPPCPVCGKAASTWGAYLPGRRSAFAGIAVCPEHGLILIELDFLPGNGEALSAKRRLRLADEQHPAYVRTKKIQWTRKAAEYEGRGNP